MGRRVSTPAADIQKLDDCLSGFSLAKHLAIGRTTAPGIHARAKRSGQRETAIHAAALAASDAETASRATALAKRLVPYLSAKIISQAFQEAVDAARRKPFQGSQASAKVCQGEFTPAPCADVCQNAKGDRT